jgi:hypothetical protein
MGARMSDDLYQRPVMQAYYATEYHRRNMQVARVIGAQAAVDQALERALSIKSIPNWMIAYLESAANRLPGLSADLAAWRDLAHDAPTPSAPDTEVEALQSQLAERDRALAEWAEVSQRNYQRAKEAEERLAEARAGLENLQSAAGEVSRQGAVTGPQWTRLNIALLSARATLAKIGGAE